MKITAITRFKHGKLLCVLRHLGWTNKDLAMRTGIGYCTINRIINLGRPSQEQATKIQFALAEQNILFDPEKEWPAAFRGFDKPVVLEQTQDVDPELLAGGQVYAQLENSYNEDRLVLLERAMSALDERELALIKEKFRLEGADVNRSAKIRAADFGISTVRRARIEAGAIRKLRIRMKLNEITK